MKTLRRNKFVWIILLSFHSINNYAQGIYMSVGSGYGFSAIPQQITYNGTEISTANNNSRSVNFTYGSYSNGINFNFTLGYNFSKQGYNFSKHFTTEIDVSYISGSSYQSTYNYINNVDSSSYTINYKAQGKMLRIIPSIKIYAEPSDFTPYLKTGLLIGFMGSLIINRDQTSYFINNNPIIDSRTIEYSKGLSLGLMAAIGTDYLISKQFSCYFELVFNAQNWAPEYSEITKYTLNGLDELSTLNISDKKTNYRSSYNSSTTYDKNQPFVTGKQYYPFSDWGFKLGLTYNFGK